MVTYDISESLKVVDYAYFIHDGVVVAEGAPASLADSTNPFVKQFVNALPDGPVAFQHQAPPYRVDMGLPA